MDTNKVDLFILTNAKYFDGYKIPAIRDLLLQTDESKWIYVQSLSFNDPSTLLIVSVIGGQFGIDRFMNGDTGLGIAKLITCGGFGVWTIVDWFLIMGVTKDKNFEKLNQALNF